MQRRAPEDLNTKNDPILMAASQAHRQVMFAFSQWSPPTATAATAAIAAIVAVAALCWSGANGTP